MVMLPSMQSVSSATSLHCYGNKLQQHQYESPDMQSALAMKDGHSSTQCDLSCQRQPDNHMEYLCTVCCIMCVGLNI